MSNIHMTGSFFDRATGKSKSIADLVKIPGGDKITRNLESFTSVFEFMTEGQIAAATLRTLSVDHSDALQLAADSGKAVYFPKGLYLWDSPDSWMIPDGATMVSTGAGYNFDIESGVVFKGTGSRVHTIVGCGETTVANPDKGAAYLADSGPRGDTYRTNDYTKPFSAAAIAGKSVKIVGLAFIPYKNGIAGYQDTDGSMSDDRDVGLWLRNADWFYLDDVATIGYWRMAGTLYSASDIGDGVIPSAEAGHAIRCRFEGGYGMSIRTPRGLGTTNYGLAGSDFINCLFKSLNHRSNHLATSSFLASPLPRPSGTLEMDGDTMRGVQFLNSTFITRDDAIMFFGNVDEIHFDGCYEESKSLRINGQWVDNTHGTRIVSTSDTVDVQFNNNSKYLVDFSPYYTRDSGSLWRYVEQNGVNNPNTMREDEYQRIKFSTSFGFRLRPGQAWRMYDADYNSFWEVNQAPGIAYRRYSTGNHELGPGILYAHGNVNPTSDNAFSLGQSTAKWSQVYASTGTINTSDAREKTKVRGFTEVEIAASAELAKEIGFYRYLSSVDEKGSDAREHCGMTVQRAIEVLEYFGLDPMSYSFICYDQWEDQPSDYNEDGTVAREGVKAGDRYGFRMDGLLAFVARGFEERLSRLEQI